MFSDHNCKPEDLVLTKQENGKEWKLAWISENGEVRYLKAPEVTKMVEELSNV